MKALLSSLILSIKFPNFPMIMPAVLSGTKILTPVGVIIAIF
ncbi:unnamed protein product [Schistosoma mattheei]|uniref:Uncharacterized protein n=1 Tax=Schistosoma mattheei TaxID=31246 RepID=A0A183Q1F9_9TREM|nr:unnamed protein product [Schistosoma mattheei]